MADKIKTNLLITGRPGVGKTTLIKKLCEDMASFNPAGFITQEIREGTTRKGFQLISLDGQKRILSHIDIDSNYQVGKYGVDVVGFEQFLMELDLLNKPAGLVVLDEIGKMECFSHHLVDMLGKLLDSSCPVLATVALKGHQVIAQVRNRSDVELFEITSTNRESLPGIIRKTLDLLLQHP